MSDICSNGHDASILGRRKSDGRCRECQNEATRRYRAKLRSQPRGTECPKCGGPYLVDATGKRYCKECLVSNLRRHQELAWAKTAEWHDWVVVNRVVSGGPDKPGRPLTKSEWFDVFRQAQDVSSKELARRACQDHGKVMKLRRIYEAEAA